MGYDLTLQGLIRKRAELAGEAERLRAQTTGCLSALDHIDAVIRLFKPDIDLDDLPVRAAPPMLTGTRGEFQRFLLDALRKADKPLTTDDLAQMVMAERRMNAKDRILAKLIRERTGNALFKLRKANKVESKKAGTLLVWAVVRL